MDEKTAGRMELAGARALALFGAGKAAKPTTAESQGSAGVDPNCRDEVQISDRITAKMKMDRSAADAFAADLIGKAISALERLRKEGVKARLTEVEAVALESIIQVRGRPAVRVLGDRLDELDSNPDNDVWREYISTGEDRMLHAASLTGAVVLKAEVTSGKPWTAGTAWLVAPNRVVTNRHVMIPEDPSGVALAENVENGSYRLVKGHRLSINFTQDNRKKGPQMSKRVTSVEFIAPPEDSVDIAVLGIDPVEGVEPLQLVASGAKAPKELLVIGHPGPVDSPDKEVQAIFGNPDGRKRVSFGRRLALAGTAELAYDASTVNGYSGGPVLGVSSAQVSGLHFYGIPGTGNLAVPADVIRTHSAYKHW